MGALAQRRHQTDSVSPRDNTMTTPRETDISRAGAVALVIDKAAPDAAAIAEGFANFGAGWRQGIETWRGLVMFPYLVLIAPNRRRIKLRAPYSIHARDPMALVSAVRAACDMLDDVTCAWILALGPEPHALVNALIHTDSRTRLADAAPRGHA
jgi:hypothetical protein